MARWHLRPFVYVEEAYVFHQVAPRRLKGRCHVGCCDESPHRHATAHFHATSHPIIEGYDPPEGWGWCYVDELIFDLEERRTPQRGPIPRYY